MKKNKSVPMVKVPVGDAFIEAGRMRGEVRVSVRAVCEALDVNFSSQLAKLKKKPWAGVALIAIPSPGGAQLTATIPLRALPMWLAGLSAMKVKPALRPRLERFQLEAAEVLARHFGLGGFQEVAPARSVSRAERRARLVLRLARSLSPASVEQRDALLVAAAEWLLPYRDGCVPEAPRPLPECAISVPSSTKCPSLSRRRPHRPIATTREPATDLALSADSCCATRIKRCNPGGLLDRFEQAGTGGRTTGARSPSTVATWCLSCGSTPTTSHRCWCARGARARATWSAAWPCGT